MSESELGNIESAKDRRLRQRYVILTAGLFLPLVISFALSKNIYPFASWTVMMSGGSLQRPWTYYVVRGETTTGDLVDIHPPELIDALSGRTWSLARAAVENDAFKLKSPHPQNRALMLNNAAAESLPRGLRVPELLKIWGGLYNARLPQSSPARIKAVRLDEYRWDSGSYHTYGRLIESWRQEL